MDMKQKIKKITHKKKYSLLLSINIDNRDNVQTIVCHEHDAKISNKMNEKFFLDQLFSQIKVLHVFRHTI